MKLLLIVLAVLVSSGTAIADYKLTCQPEMFYFSDQTGGIIANFSRSQLGVGRPILYIAGMIAGYPSMNYHQNRFAGSKDSSGRLPAYASYPEYGSYPHIGSYPVDTTFPTYSSYPNYDSMPVFGSYPTYLSFPNANNYPSEYKKFKFKAEVNRYGVIQHFEVMTNGKKISYKNTSQLQNPQIKDAYDKITKNFYLFVKTAECCANPNLKDCHH